MSQEGDIADEGFVNAFVRDVATRFSRIDYSVSCAGILGEPLRSHETPTAAFDLITNVNYKGTWLASRAVLGHMLRQRPHEGHPGQRGAIVNIASQLGVVARPAAGGSHISSLNLNLCASLNSHFLVSCSPLLRIKGSNHQHDPVGCHRLLTGRHQGELRLPRCDRDTDDDVIR